MKATIGLIIALSAVSASALDLTPNFTLVASDGVVLQLPYFMDGAKKYSLILNSDTELTPDDGGALFRFIKYDHGEMRLRLSSFGVDVGFGPDTLDAYQQAATKMLPQVAEGVVLEKQLKNPLPMNAWQSYRFYFKYTTAAGSVRESITFLNITPTQQVVMDVYAMESNFDIVAARADDVIRRWYELDPKAVLRGN
jgi:hypothetical protein